MARGTILAALDAGLVRREAGLLSLTARGEAEARATLPRDGSTPTVAARG